MDINITLKNYRCFSDAQPARICVRKGFTAFIGVNNSGKSSLLKFFFEFRTLFGALSSPSSLLSVFAPTKPSTFGMQSTILDTEELFYNRNDRDLEIELRLSSPHHITKDEETTILERAVITVPRSSNTFSVKLYAAGKQLPRDSELRLQDTSLVIKSNGSPIVELAEFCQACRDLSRMLYIPPFRNAINLGANTAYYDISTGQAFINAWRVFKTGANKKSNEAADRLTEEIRHIFGFNRLEINASDNDQTLKIIIDGKSYALSELGSGIAQFILVLIAAATRHSSFILIDEPESNLHPSLQLDFLTTLGSYADEGVLFATHSIGLARTAADAGVYSVRKGVEKGSEIAKLEETPRLSEFLGELSFSGYRDLGFNQVLLVEGRTEIKTVQQFLRKYKRDHEVVILSLGGSEFINAGSETEIEEMKRISKNLCVLIDSERITAGEPLGTQRAAFVAMCKRLKIRCHVLDRRATENYLPDEAVKKVKGEKYRALGHYEKLTEALPSWNKAENWRIARAMDVDELDKTDLGEFLRSL